MVEFFFSHFNGVSVFHNRWWDSNDDLQLYSDSAGGEGFGFGIYFGGKWACSQWPENWHTLGMTKDITLLEVFPIFVALKVWGQQLKNRRLCFNCDNQAVVHTLNSMTSKNDRVMVILRMITLLCLEFNLLIKARHVPGANNGICDSISRFQMDRFRKLAPLARELPEPLPQDLWDIFREQH